MSTHFIKEACVEGLDQALKAEKLGADRIELCADLKQDGLTPEIDVIMEAKDRIQIPIRVMVRPRPGNFVYSRQEIQEMFASIEICKSLGIEGVVFGALKENNKLNIKVIGQLCEAAGSMTKIFHKAVEQTPDIVDSCKSLFESTPIDAVLTAGGKGKAVDNLSALREILAVASKKELVACGKITDQNLSRIHEALGAKAYHGRKIVGKL
ncbi:MAG: copper homeostasis protein CutC [Bacteroidota bacterium]